jgi:hypothetical protein
MLVVAYTRDVGRGVARLDYDSMDSLNTSTGDVVEIGGKRRTVAKCLPLHPSDEGKGRIRVDGLVRNNAGEVGSATCCWTRCRMDVYVEAIPDAVIGLLTTAG